MPEYAPAALRWLADEIVAAIPSAEFSGIVGDPAHTYGYHRARNVLPSSDYSVQTAPDRKGDGWAASAFDIKFNSTWMKIVTKRLMDSAKDPYDLRLNCMREFFGTLDGSTVVGWDTYYGHPVTSDDSHRWHVHGSVLRQYADNKTELAKVLAVIKGEDDVTAEEVWTERIPDSPFSMQAYPDWSKQGVNSARVYLRTGATYSKLTHTAVTALTAQVAALTAAVGALAADHGTSPDEVKAAAEAGARAALADLDISLDWTTDGE